MATRILPLLCVLVTVPRLVTPVGNVQPEGKQEPSSWAPGKLLVVPMDGSHWVGIKAVAEEMAHRGHHVLVVIPEASMRLGPGEHFETLTYPVPYTQDVVDELLEEHSQNLQSNTGPLEKISKVWTRVKKLSNFMIVTSESLLFNETLVAFLREQEFDAILTDPMMPTGAILAHNFSAPPVCLHCGIPCGFDWVATACPSSPSDH